MGVRVEDERGPVLGQMWERNKNAPLAFGSFGDIEYIRAQGIFQESDISHYIIAALKMIILKDANEHLMLYMLINIRDITHFG